MPRVLVENLLIALGFGSALWTWYSVVHAIEVDGLSSWVIPGVAASGMIIMALLVMILARQWQVVAIMAAVFFGSVVFFVQGLVVGIASIIGVVGYLSAWRTVREDVRNHLRIHVFAHARAGVGRVITVTALMISAVFYQALVERDVANVLLSNSLHATITGPIARMVLPAPLAQGSGAHGEVTVDDFIAQMLQERSSAGGNISLQFLEDYAAAVGDRLKTMVPLGAQQSQTPAVIPDVVRAQARTALSEQLGIPLTGNELVADVFVQSLERQIQTFAQERVLPEGYKFSKALAGVIAFFLFLTVSWIGTFVKIFWLWAAQGLFALLRKTGMVQVQLVQTEKEEIV